MKIAISLLNLVALSAVGLWGQDAPKDLTKTARIEGVVTNTAGEPVARAQVRLAGPIAFKNGNLAPGAAYVANSDDAGKFTIEGIEPNTGYNLQSTKTGYVAGRYGARTASGPAVTLALEAGESVTGVRLRMAQQGAVAGRVVDESGDPVAGARISLQARSYPGGGNLSQLLTSAITGSGANPGATSDDRGEFRIAPVSAGRYYVSVSAQRNSAVTNSNTAMLSTYYPSAADTRGATLLTIAAGQVVSNIEVRMRRGRIYTASGKVVNESGGPVAGAQVIAMPAGMRDLAEIVPMILELGSQATKADGTFVLRNMPAGPYELAAIDATAAQALTQGQSMQLATGSFAIVSEDFKDLTLVMGTGPIVTGTVRLEGGELREIVPEAKPGSNGVEQMLQARVAALLGGAAGSDSPLSVGLSGTTLSLIVGAPAGMVQQDGTFKVDGLAPGEYQMQFGSLPAGVYLKSAKYGETDALANAIQLGTKGGSLDLVFAKNGGTAAATVANDKNEPEVGVTIVLWTADPLPGLAGSVRTASTDRRGSAEFKNLRPGTYYMAAFESVDQGLVQSRDFLKLLQGDAVKVEIAEGAQVKQALKWIPAEKLAAAEEKVP